MKRSMRHQNELISLLVLSVTLAIGGHGNCRLKYDLYFWLIHSFIFVHVFLVQTFVDATDLNIAEKTLHILQ